MSQRFKAMSMYVGIKYVYEFPEVRQRIKYFEVYLIYHITTPSYHVVLPYVLLL